MAEPKENSNENAIRHRRYWRQVRAAFIGETEKAREETLVRDMRVKLGNNHREKKKQRKEQRTTQEKRK